MKQTFLSELAEQIIASGINLAETAVVLPNKRAQRMLLKELATKYQKPVFAPDIYTINDFIAYLSPLETLDKVSLLVQLYTEYKALAGDEADDFDAALTWMPAFVDDMSEVDKQLDDAPRILHELAYAKEFEIPFGHDNVSAEAEKKVRFFGLLSDLYLRFKDTLLEKKQAYDGLLYRDCAENIASYHEKLTYKHFVFAGFHVLNPAELTVVKFIKEHFDTQFYFDVDPFYCDFEKNERYTTAHFLHRICDVLSLPKEKILFNQNCYDTVKKDVEIVGTSKEMNQIFYAIKCLEDIQKKQGNLDDTALVLADENLLPALLASYDIKDANVTMGYPFTATPVYSLLGTLMEMYQSGLSYRRSAGTICFHRRTILALLHCPLIKNYLFEDQKAFNNLTEKLETEQRSLYAPQDLRELPLPVFSGETSDLLQSIVDYLQQIADALQEEEAANDKALLQLLMEQLDAVKQQLQPLQEMGIPITLSIVKFAIRQNVGALSVPIKGDALHGLQIMGLLETRTLDFKNVIMLSVNEGVLPAGISYNSIIPFDFKFHDESLENYLYKDQVYAYHFFRLLQRAEKVVLLYNNNCTGSLAEKSRFITQLEFEVRERRLEEVIKISYPAVAFPYSNSANETLEVAKTEEILQFLYQFRYSASALKNYINCPLQFYLNNVCHIRQRTTFKDRIESNVIGTVVHAVFEHVLSAKGSHNYSKRIDDFLSNLETNVNNLILTDENLQKEMPLRAEDMTHGRVYLALQMVYNDVKNYLKKAKVELEGVTILDNELELETKIKVGEHELTLHGFIDRLQKRDGHLEVIDYKTGRVDDSKLKVSMDAVWDVFTNPQYEKFLQLFFYALMCKDTKEPIVVENRGSLPIQCAIISIPDANKGANYIHKAILAKERKGRSLVAPTESFEPEYLEELEAGLKELLSQIIDKDRKFSQTPDSKRCVYCDFKHICRR